MTHSPRTERETGGVLVLCQYGLFGISKYAAGRSKQSDGDKGTVIPIYELTLNLHQITDISVLQGTIFKVISWASCHDPAPLDLHCWVVIVIILNDIFISFQTDLR